MQLDVTGKNIEVTEALRSYVAEKLERVQRHLDEVRDAHVVLSVEKHRHFAEINLNANGTTLHADAEDRDMYAAIDAMADKIDRQARRHHGKATDHTPHQAQEVPGESPGSGE